jgi:hypothetical protein
MKTITINVRIQMLCDFLNITPNALSVAIGNNSNNIIYNVLQGKNKPSYPTLYGILETYPQISAEWLMRGEGPIKRSRMSTPVGVSEPSSEPYQSASIKYVGITEQAEYIMKNQDPQYIHALPCIDKMLFHQFIYRDFEQNGDQMYPFLHHQDMVRAKHVECESYLQRGLKKMCVVITLENLFICNAEPDGTHLKLSNHDGWHTYLAAAEVRELWMITAVIRPVR